MKIFFEISGWIAAIIGCIMTAPQAVNIYKTKSTKGLSSSSYSIFLLGISLWVIQSGMVHSIQGALVNIFAGFVTLYVVAYIYKNKDMFKHFYLILILIFTFLVVGVTLFILDLNINTWVVFAIGILAGVCTTFAFSPQIISEFKSKDRSSQTIATCTFIILTNVFWLPYFGGYYATGWKEEMQDLTSVLPIFIWVSCVCLIQTTYILKILSKR